MNRLLSLLLLLSIGMAEGYTQPLPQNALDLTARERKLKELASELKIATQKNREKAHQMAPEKGWVIFEVNETGQIISLEGVDEGGQPIYYTTLYNTQAAATIGTNLLWPDGLLGLSLNGSSNFMTGKLGVWDGGKVRDTHQELVGRIVFGDNAVSLSDHATHVSGTMVASGVSSLAKGMSFGTQQLKAWDFSNDAAEIASAASNLLVSNHSYGSISGWRYNSARAGTAADPYWEWWGDPDISTFEDYKFGVYNSATQYWDQIAYNAPYYLIVKSAGNNRNSNGPSVGQPYWQRTSSGSWLLVPSRVSGAVSSNNTYDIVPTNGNAKNILTVGAVNPIPNGYRQISDVIISSFSSWGPTDDGRIKPDIVANGVNLISSVATGDANYSNMSGTSMSAPNASGSIFLLQEHFHNLNGSFMLSSTLKGLVCHTADEAGNMGPDYVYGWGLINMSRAANVISNSNENHLIEEVSLQNNQTIIREVIASGNGPLVVTICWTDPQGTPIPYGVGALNNRTPMLVNDLDLRINSDIEVFQPWILNVENPSAPATKGDNYIDNIEQVVIENPVPGKTYTITINHKGTLASNQILSLIASGIGGNPICASAALNSSNSRIDRFVFNTIDNLTNSGCHTYRDFTHLKASVSAGQTLPFSLTIGTCGSEVNRIAKIFVDWNSNGTFEPNELAATSGVISASGIFSGYITIPESATPDHFGIVRIVLVETNNASDVTPCGTYGNGETQDYLVQFTRASIDLGLTSFVHPMANPCISENQIIEVNFENMGNSTITSINFVAEVFEDGELAGTYNETISTSLAPYQTSSFRFTNTFATQPNSSYTVLCSALVSGDSRTANNTLELNFDSNAAEITNATAALCEGSSTVLLKANAEGTIYWYDAPNNGNVIGIGSNLNTTVVPSNSKYYVGVNTLKATVGPATKDSQPWTSGTYAQATAHPIITTHIPLVIKSARLYVGWPGLVTFWIEEANTGYIVSLTNIRVSATRNPASSSTSAPNDPSDSGAEYQLNLTIPTPGTYRIRVSYSEGATLYRNNANSSNPYPYNVSDVISINTTSATGDANSYYYWLYNMKVENMGCKSAIMEIPLQEIENPVVSIAVTHENGSAILDAGNAGSSFTWNTGSNNQTITVNQSGNYTVTVTNPWGCSAQGSVQVTITDISPVVDLPVSVYPNPASSIIHIEGDIMVRFEIFSIIGTKVMHGAEWKKKHSIDISKLPKATYIIRITGINSNEVKMYRIVVN